MDCNIKEISRFESDFVSNFETCKAEKGFCAVVATQTCVIEIISDIEILDDGKTLLFKDLSIYPQGQENFKGKAKGEIFSLQRQIVRAVKKLGFSKLIIDADRLDSSTSANPGHHVHMEIRLREGKDEIADSKQ